MATELVTVSPETDMDEAIEALLDNRVSGMPVVDANGTLAGMLSEKDCLKLASAPGGVSGRVGDFMTADVMVVPPEMDIADLSGLFLEHTVRRFPVVDQGKLVGQISRHDALKAMMRPPE